MPWVQLKEILDDNRKAAEAARREPLVCCPNCGHQLQYNQKQGRLACPFGDFETTGRPPGG